MQKIAASLWFDNQAEGAATFYTSVFKNSKILNTTYYTEVGKEIHGQAAGTVMTVNFELNGQTFTALNGGPLFTFSEAISFQVFCEDQAEIDYYWEKLSADPAAEQCGWLKDKFGVSWQVVPSILGEMMQDVDEKKAGNVMQAMLQMKKIDVAALKQAYEKE